MYYIFIMGGGTGPVALEKIYITNIGNNTVTVLNPDDTDTTNAIT